MVSSVKKLFILTKIDQSRGRAKSENLLLDRAAFFGILDLPSREGSQRFYAIAQSNSSVTSDRCPKTFVKAKSESKHQSGAIVKASESLFH